MTPDPSLQGAVERSRKWADELDDAAARAHDTVMERRFRQRAADLRILAALPEPPSKSAESGDEAMVDTVATDNWLTHARNAYRAMIAAGPKPPERPR